MGDKSYLSHSKDSYYSDFFVGVRLTGLDLWLSCYHLICVLISLAHFFLLNEDINQSNGVYTICKMMLLFCKKGGAGYLLAI